MILIRDVIRIFQIVTILCKNIKYRECKIYIYLNGLSYVKSEIKT